MPYLILCFQFSRMLRNNRQILNLCRQKCQVSVADNGVATLALAAPPVNTLNAELLSSIKTNMHCPYLNCFIIYQQGKSRT